MISGAKCSANLLDLQLGESGGLGYQPDGPLARARKGGVGEEFPLQCPACGGDIRLIAFITEPGPIRKILTHLGEPREPPPITPARGPPTEWADLVQAHDDRDVFQASPDELPEIDIHAL